MSAAAERSRSWRPNKEAIVRTNHETLCTTYDDVDLDEITAAVAQAGLLGSPENQLAAARWQQKHT